MPSAFTSRLLVLAANLSLTAICTAQSQPVVAHAATDSRCPVMVTAKYIPDAVIQPVGPLERGTARRPLHVTFGTMTHASFADVTPGQSLEANEARITVRGMTEKGGVIPAGVAAGSPWLEKSFTVNVTRNPAGMLSSTVWLTGFGSVSDVRVDSLTFRDGRTWKATASESCHAATGSVLRSAK